VSLIMAPVYAAVILVTPQGQVAVQVRDDKPGIADPGKLMVFAGALLAGEEPADGAARELEEETTLRLPLEFFGSFIKSPQRHGRAGLVHAFLARDVDVSRIDVREGQGYRLIGEQDLDAPECSVITRDILREYFTREKP
jgi:8-oxo-dGTP pyrophosphatase MutT (NUDIX family)